MIFMIFSETSLGILIKFRKIKSILFHNKSKEPKISVFDIFTLTMFLYCMLRLIKSMFIFHKSCEHFYPYLIFVI